MPRLDISTTDVFCLRGSRLESFSVKINKKKHGPEYLESELSHKRTVPQANLAPVRFQICIHFCLTFFNNVISDTGLPSKYQLYYTLERFSVNFILEAFLGKQYFLKDKLNCHKHRRFAVWSDWLKQILSTQDKNTLVSSNWADNSLVVSAKKYRQRVLMSNGWI